MTVLEAENLTEEKAELVALVTAAQAGDRLAFGELAARFERAVYATALRRLNNHAEAQELVQDVFMQALRKIHQLRQPEAFSGWLRSITVRLATNRAVRRAPLLAAENDVLEANSRKTADSPLDNVLAGERAREVQRGLSQLGEMDREALEAFYVKGQSLAEISTELERPVGTIKRRLHVARKRLARALEEMAV